MAWVSTSDPINVGVKLIAREGPFSVKVNLALAVQKSFMYMSLDTASLKMVLQLKA